MPGSILAIDPGGTTGVATRMPNGRIIAGAFKEHTDIYAMLSNVDEVVIEGFYTAGRISRDGLHTVRIVGGVQALCWYLNKPCCLHMPHTRKPFIAQARALLGRGVTPHEIDATAHLLAYEHLQPSRRRALRDTLKL